MKSLISSVALLAAMIFCGTAVALVGADAQPDPAAQKSGDNRVVFVTKTGTKYHLAGCSSLSKSFMPVRLGDARRKYLPCSVCKPPK